MAMTTDASKKGSIRNQPVPPKPQEAAFAISVNFLRSTVYRNVKDMGQLLVGLVALWVGKCPYGLPIGPVSK